MFPRALIEVEGNDDKTTPVHGRGIVGYAIVQLFSIWEMRIKNKDAMEKNQEQAGTTDSTVSGQL